MTEVYHRTPAKSSPATPSQVIAGNGKTKKNKGIDWQLVWDIVFAPVYILIEIFSFRPIKEWVRQMLDAYLMLSFVLFFITSWYIEYHMLMKVDLSVYEHDVRLL